eukprot:Anaeramoba_flamelloidesa825067_7.p1 GENE.a825067_7~~a825067_7.p1  ORF type:complete len:210 (+),score=49.77 a825067_7:104-733(+)
MEFKHFYCLINRQRIYFSIQYLEEIFDKFPHNFKKSTPHQPKWVTEIKKKSYVVMKKRQKKLLKKKNNNNHTENEVCLCFQNKNTHSKKPSSFPSSFASQTPPPVFFHTHSINNNSFINQNNMFNKNSQTEKPKKRTKLKYQHNNKKPDPDSESLFEPRARIQSDPHSNTDSNYDLSSLKLKSGSKKELNYKQKKIKNRKRKQEMGKKK